MIPTGRDLRDMLVTLYGGRDWLRRGSEEIGVSPRTLRRWTSGEDQPTIRNCGKIRRAVARNRDLAQHYADECGV